jgi:hypothetical protein
MTEVGWYPLADLTVVDEEMRARILSALDERGEARFEAGADQASSRRMRTRGNPASTDPVSAALWNPARSKSARVPT